jgi:hypothetical protein
MTELVERRHFRKEIPKEHRGSLDTRLRWLWNQRFGTIQTVWKDSPDILDKTAATLFLQAIMAKDLDSISLLFQRLEGGAQVDEEVLEQASMRV